jgi:ABC-type transporter Mla subunit MlaD
MTTKEHLSKHDREIAEIRAVQKRTEANIDKLVLRTEESISKLASAHARETAEIWVLMGKLAKGTEAAQDETRDIRDAIRELATAHKDLAAAQKRTEATLRAYLESLRGGNGHRKRNLS